MSTQRHASTVDSQDREHANLPYPAMRMRRLRSSPSLRAMVRETHLRLEKLIYPLFVVEGTGVKKPISSMPGIHQQSVDMMLKEVEAS